MAMVGIDQSGRQVHQIIPKTYQLEYRRGLYFIQMIEGGKVADSLSGGYSTTKDANLAIVNYENKKTEALRKKPAKVVVDKKRKTRKKIDA